MTQRVRKISLRDVVICAAFIWAYQECVRSQWLADPSILARLDERTDRLWELLKQSEKADNLKEEHRKLFRFLFQKEFQTFSSLMSSERTDRIEQMELFLKKIGYDPEMRRKGE